MTLLTCADLPSPWGIDAVTDVPSVGPPRPRPSPEHLLLPLLGTRGLSASRPPPQFHCEGLPATPGPECGRNEGGRQEGRGSPGGGQEAHAGRGRRASPGRRAGAGRGCTVWPAWGLARARLGAGLAADSEARDAGQHLEGAGAPLLGSLSGINLTLKGPGLGHPGGSVC